MVQTWSHNTPESRGNETFVFHRVITNSATMHALPHVHIHEAEVNLLLKPHALASIGALRTQIPKRGPRVRTARRGMTLEPLFRSSHTRSASARRVQGYLAHEKLSPPRTLQWAYLGPWGGRRWGVGGFFSAMHPCAEGRFT